MLAMLYGLNRHSLEDPLRVLRFYSRLLRSYPALSLFVIVVGFLVRGVSVVVFVLTLKVFISILDPDAALNVINQVLVQQGWSPLTTNGLVSVMVGALSILICSQFALNKIGAYSFLHLRSKILNRLLESPINQDARVHFNICLDRVPLGLEAVVKVCEILLFYVVLIANIFFWSVLSGVLVLIIVPIIIFLMLAKGRKEVHLTVNMQQERRDIAEFDDDCDEYLRLKKQTYLIARNNVVYADLFGGLAIVFLTLAFVFMGPSIGGGVTGVTALLLVFSIRFAIVYAGELGRQLGKVLQQRVIVEKITLPRNW